MQKSEAQARLLVGRVFAALSSRSTAGILVETAAGTSTFTDNRGYFSINVRPHDTLYYYTSQLNKSIPYPVDSIKKWDGYAIAIQTIEYDIARARRLGYPVDNQDPSPDAGQRDGRFAQLPQGFLGKQVGIRQGLTTTKSPRV